MDESQIPEVPFSPAADPLEPDENAPYGYTFDEKTGERRPKKSAGRPRRGTGAAPRSTNGVPPSLDELKAGELATAQTDREPGSGRRPRGKRRKSGPREDAPPPPFRAGPIAKGVNRMYLKAGKIVRLMDADIGAAIIASVTKEAEDDTTVGEQWEEVARNNPRIRAFLLNMIETSAWGGLIGAHIPILLAVLMKEGIRKRIPFMKLITTLLEDDETGSPSDISQAMGGVNGMDVAQMFNMAQGMMAGMAANVARPGGMPRAPGTVVESVVPGFWSNEVPDDEVAG